MSAGLLLAILGNAIVGIGLFLQKFALSSRRPIVISPLSWNPLSRLTTFSGKSSEDSLLNPSSSSQTPPPPYATINANYLSRRQTNNTSVVDVNASQPKKLGAQRQRKSSDHFDLIHPTKPRFQNPLWIGGVVLAYFGEALNFLALSRVSAALVTPLGVLSVLINAVLGTKFLNETISGRQQRGYLFILSGVMIILFAAPKKERELSDVVSYLADAMNSSLFTLGFLCVLVLQTLLIFKVTVQGSSKLLYFVIIAAIFGSITINAGKAVGITTRVRVEGLSPISNQVNANNERISIPDVQTSNQIINATTQESASAFSASIAAKASALTYATPVLFGSLIFSGVGSEIFKQAALSKFPITQFQPLFYSGFNTLSIISGVFLFGEFTEQVNLVTVWNWGECGVFLAFFSLGMMLIGRGASRLLEANTNTGGGPTGPGLTKMPSTMNLSMEEGVLLEPGQFKSLSK